MRTETVRSAAAFSYAAQTPATAASTSARRVGADASRTAPLSAKRRRGSTTPFAKCDGFVGIGLLVMRNVAVTPLSCPSATAQRRATSDASRASSDSAALRAFTFVFVKDSSVRDSPESRARVNAAAPSHKTSVAAAAAASPSVRASAAATRGASAVSTRAARTSTSPRSRSRSSSDAVAPQETTEGVFLSWGGRLSRLRLPDSPGLSQSACPEEAESYASASGASRPAPTLGAAGATLVAPATTQPPNRARICAASFTNLSAARGRNTRSASKHFSSAAYVPAAAAVAKAAPGGVFF